MAQATVVTLEQKALYLAAYASDVGALKVWRPIVELYAELGGISAGATLTFRALQDKAVDSNRRGPVLEAYCAVIMAEHFGSLTAGTDEYKTQRRTIYNRFLTCAGRALQSLARDKGIIIAAGKRGTKTATGTESKPANGKESTATPSASDVAPSVAADLLQAHLRAVSIGSALVAFQTGHKLTKGATEAIGSIAEDFGKLAELITSMSGKFNEKG